MLWTSEHPTNKWAQHETPDEWNSVKQDLIWSWSQDLSDVESETSVCLPVNCRASGTAAALVHRTGKTGKQKTLLAGWFNIQRHYSHKTQCHIPAKWSMAALTAH